MGQEFESLHEEQKQSFRDQLNHYGLDPEAVIREGSGRTVWDVFSVQKVKELFGIEGPVTPPPPHGEKTPARLAQDYVFGYRELDEKELDRVDGHLGPIRVKIESAPDINITKDQPLKLEGGVEIREYGVVTIEDGGQIIISDCLARISCQRLVKK